MCRNKWFLRLVVLVFLWPYCTIRATNIVIYPTNDAFISHDNAYENYGASDSIMAGRDSEGDVTRGYLKFDLSTIPQGKIIGWAQLRLAPNFITWNPPELGIHYLPEDSWDEMTITWDNAPTTFSSEPSDIVEIPLSGDDCFWTVTGDVEQEYADDGILSLVLKSAYEWESSRAGFWSKEFIIHSEWPYLQVEYGNRYAGGNGTKENPYLISYYYQLNEIGKDPNCWDKHFKLISDIDLSMYTGTLFNMIGKYVAYDSPENKPFTGTFDGDGHVITGFTYDSTTTDCIGVFSYVSGESVLIKNLGLTDPNVRGDENIGALVGLIEDGTIRGCYVSGGEIGGSDSVGGLIGYSDRGHIYECCAQTTVQGDSFVGVLIGRDYVSEVVCSYSDGSAMGQTEFIGGLAGGCYGGVRSHCYSTASAEGNNAVGGLAGDGRGGTFDNCYAAGAVIGLSGTGGLLGAKYSGQPTVYDCFWDYQTTGQSSSVGGGTMLTTAQMQDANNFQAQGWDFVGSSDGPSELWAMPGGGYPILWWQLDPLPELPEFSGGSGQTNDPYLISTAIDLRSIGFNPRLMNSHFKITSDIDLAAVPFYTIAKTHPNMKYFAYKAVFDGNNRTISNLSCPSDKRYQTGLLGYVFGQTAGIKNLVLTNVDVNVPSWSNVGAIVCALENAALQDCRIEGADVVGYQYVGSFVGSSKRGNVYRCRGVDLNISGNTAVGGLAGSSIYEEAQIINCSTEGAVSADIGAAGFVCTNYGGLIKGCYADVNVSSSTYGAAGFLGDQLGTVVDCHAQGQVSSIEWVGGMFAIVDRGANSINCYTTCLVDGNDYTGGFTGVHLSGIYSGCFWNSEVNPDINSIGYIQDGNDANIYGLTTAELQTRSTFTNVGWDFISETTNGYEDIWRMCQDGVDYPELSWEFTKYGDMTCPDGVDFIDYSVLADQWLLEKLEQDYNLDGRVNFKDWATFANNWDVNYAELSSFLVQWLAQSATIADIAPAGGDGFVDWQDLMLLCEHWLSQ